MLIEATDSILFNTVTDTGKDAVVLSERLEVGSTLATAYDVVTSSNENEYLGTAQGQDLPPLPEFGVLCEIDSMYSYDEQVIMSRQTHNRTEHAPEDTPALWLFYREGEGVLDWISGESVTVGVLRIYDTLEYTCIQSHVTQEDWTPPDTPTLWALTVPTGEWQPGVLYTIGVAVDYIDEINYTCIQEHTSQVGWEPPNVPALWEVT